MSLDLDAIEARAKATSAPRFAAVGDWYDEDGVHFTIDPASTGDDAPHTISILGLTGEGADEQRNDIATIEGSSFADANFIAQARQDVPALIAEVRRLQAALANAIIAHSDMADALGVNQ